MLTGDWSNTDYSGVWGNSGSSTPSGGTSYPSSGVAPEGPAVASGNQTAMKGQTITLPQGLGTSNTFMGWQKITAKSSKQYQLRDQAGQNFDANGYGKINGRYTVATTNTYGNVGDYIDIKRADGSTLNAIIADIKNQNDDGCNKWGHDDGHTVVEFVVDQDKWYKSNNGSKEGYNIIRSTTPGNNRSSVVSITNQGSYFSGGNGGFGRASMVKPRYYNPTRQRVMPQGGRGTNIDQNGTRNVSSLAASKQYNNYRQASNYMSGLKGGNPTDLLMTVIEILSDISGNTRVSSEKLDMLKNINNTGSNINVINGGSSNNVSNTFSSAANNTPASSRNDVSALRIARGSAY